MAELSVVSGNLYDCKPLFVPSAGCLLVATGSAITAVSAETGEKLGQLLGHKASVTCLALVPADSRLATHFQSNTSTISTGTSTGTAASMSGSRAVVVSGSLDGEAIVWDSVRLHRLSGESAIQFKTSIFDLLPIRAGAMLARKQTGRFCVDLLAVVEKIFHPGKREVETVASSEEKESGKPAEGFRANRRLYAAVGFECTNGTTGTKVNTLYTPRQGICLLAGDGETSDLLISASVCKLSIQSGKEPSKQLKFLAATDSRITSLCCGSSESAPQGVVVAGHESGEITVYHDIRAYFQRSHIVVDSTSKRPLVSSPAATTCHWHAHPVAALTLATDCTHIFSGGEEGVLVMWPVNTNVATSVSSSNRSFLPRLGAPISQLSAMVDIDSDEELDQNGFSSNGTRVVVTTIDNCVRVVNAASMSVVWVLRLLAISCRSHTIASLLYRNSRGSRAQGTSSKTPTTVDSTKSTALTTNLLSPALAQYVQSDNNWRCCISLEPRTGYLVCNGYPGQLQAFDLSAQAFVTSYTVTDYTRVSRAEYYSQIYAPSLTLFEIITIAGIGHFMVTVDARRGEELDPESSLKFWQWNESKNCYRVSAQVDNPHGSGVRLSGIAVSPVFYKTIVEDSIRGAHQASYVLCVTTAVNGTIKFWQGIQQLVNEAYNGDVLPLRWTCLFSFCYRECPTRGVTFSKDGSLLALAFQSSVSLWQPLSTGPALKATLTCQHSSPIQFARFIEPESGSCSDKPSLLVGSKTAVTLFDLLTLTPRWEYRGKSLTTLAVARSIEEALKLPFRNSSYPVLATMDKGNTEHGWIAVVNKVCAGNIDIDGVGETEGESDNDSVTEERATDVEEKEDDKAVEEDQHYELLLFGLSCNHPISVYKLNSKPNSATFCSCIEDGGQRKTSLLLVTENCELLKLSPVVAEKSVHYGQVAFVKRPSLPEIILNKPLVAANDRSDHLAVVDEALAAYLEGRRDNQTVVPSYQNWLSNLMGDTTSAVSVVGSVATDFMDSLLPKRNHQVLSSSGNSVSAPETSYRNGVNPRDPARQGEIGTNEKLVESCLNFDILEKEFDDSLLSCFATDQNKTGNSSRTSISKHGKSTTNRAIRSTRSRSNSTDSDFNGDQKLVATVTASITNNPHSPIKKGKKGQSEGLVDTNPVVKDIAVKSGRNSKRKSSDDISVDSESSQTRKSLRLQSK